MKSVTGLLARLAATIAVEARRLAVGLMLLFVVAACFLLRYGLELTDGPSWARVVLLLAGLALLGLSVWFTLLRRGPPAP